MSSTAGIEVDVSGSARPYALVPALSGSHAVSSSSSGSGAIASISTTATSHAQHAGVHDTMRYGPRSLAHDAGSGSGAGAHPLQHRLEKWDSTRDALKLQLQRDMYGIAAPLRVLVERKIVAHDPHFPTLRPASQSISQLHLDILNGNDESIEPAEFMLSATQDAVGSELVQGHAIMEQKWRV